MNKTQAKQEGRIRRHARIRAKVSGTAACPRLSVYKSNRYLHAQVIDDIAGRTILSGTTKGAEGKKTESAVSLGAKIAKLAKEAHIAQVVFDRGGFRYAGRVAAFADAVRAGGITF